MIAERYRTILISGPTASGKSGLALRLAERLGGIVVNADSMQVYSDIPIISAQPSRADQARAPHALYGHVDAAMAHSTGEWLRETQALLDGEGRSPLIFTGGTGLYFNALTAGLAEVPAVPDEVRLKWREALATDGASRLHAELERRDADMAARLKPHDGVRIVRALEVLEATGKSLLQWQRQTRRGPVDVEDASVIAVLVNPPAESLPAIMTARLEAMFEAGADTEVRQLLARNLPTSLPAMNAIGVREVSQWLFGSLTREEALEKAVIATRQYAKRQRTWFRGRFGPAWRTFTSAAAAHYALFER